MDTAPYGRTGSTVDVVVIGTGPGGEAATGALARSGLDVVAVEDGLVGGECPYYGCIPSKTLIRSADLLASARRADGVAGEVAVTPRFADAYARVRDVTADWDDSASVARLERAGATIVRGTATLTGPRTVAVGDRTWSARRGVLLDVGTRPSAPPIDGLDGTPYWTNRDILRSPDLPRSLLVLGGGAVGLELAQAYARYGTVVTVVESGPRLLAHEEPEAGDLVVGALQADGVTVRTGSPVAAVAYDGERFAVTLDDGSDLDAERLLVATGRTPNTDRLGLQELGVPTEHGFVTTDPHQRVLSGGAVVDGLWAIGDVTGRGGFTHVSMYQSAIAVATITGQKGPGASYRALPRVTFTDPEIGAVGLTEEQARRRGLPVRTGITDLAATSRGATYGPGASGLIKVVADAERRVLVGATSAGPAGGEILGALTVAIQARVPVEELLRTIWAYPTFHRAIGSALADLS
ncbi:NAD(P)/FAD-dependent oxidoreductase [Mumia sp. zg.B21]|uniref:dihydrolipoyl dehydrogenase family protein n=1 Tax=Mumia sp. zg.B21 TaxID=2855447 RepID=UPI001C6E3D49|nr:NAD(P)/FAD-dependent oxidoreductase [Mumia sp. zg.B21]MBW9211583.1 NAD(P)/FAD-dependent oxidoreductase [Mumia sp. zg.B21]